MVAASGYKSGPRQLMLDIAAQSLAEAEALISEHPTVPDFLLFFVRGDLRMLEGRHSEAIAEYQRFQQEARHWISDGGTIVSAQREAIAMAAARHPGAWQSWRAGLRAARKARASPESEIGRVGWWASLPAAASERSRVHQLQYAAAIPGIVLRSSRWLFWIRRGAAKWVYPTLEALYVFRHGRGATGATWRPPRT